MRRIVLIIFIFTIGLFLPQSFVLAESVISPHTFAWSDNIGYINFASTTVDDSLLGGYAWSANKGFIKFNPVQGGVLNDGAGNLSGSAWGEQLGWIDFNNVSIDANGKFTGTATGELVGTITFDCHFCDVQTDWRPAAPISTSTPANNNNGGGIPLVPENPVSAIQPVAESAGQAALSPDEQAKSAFVKHIDILKDGIIDIIDFNAMMVNWGKTENGNIADMNEDGIVDILDFNWLMVYWGTIYNL